MNQIPVASIVDDEEALPEVTLDSNSTPSFNPSSLDFSSIINSMSSMTPAKAKDYISMIPENMMPPSIRSAILGVLDKATGGAVRKEEVLSAIQNALSPLGIDMMGMAKQYLSQRAAITGTTPVKGGAHVFWVTSSRQIKLKKVAGGTIDETAKMVLKGNPVSSPWTRLSIGPWKGKSVKIWYNQVATGGKNKMTSVLLGLPTNSEMLIYVEDHPATEKELETVLSKLKVSTGFLD